MRFITLLLLGACAISKPVGAPKPPPGPYEEVVEKFASRKDIEHKLQNRFNYLRMLFEQSTDPYFGNKRWAESCLKENHWSEVKKTDKGMFLVAHLFLNSNKEAGYCPGMPAWPTYEIRYSCHGSLELHTIRILSHKAAADTNWESLCD